MSQFDCDAHEAKMSAKKITAGEIPAFEGRESELHDKIILYCRNRRWLCFHGSTAHRAMRTAGEPDFHIYGTEGRYWMIECKTKTGKLSPEQLAIKMMAEMNQNPYYVVRSYEEFLKVIQP